MTRTPTGRVRVNFHCHPEIWKAMQRIATVRGTSASELVRIAAHEYVLREGQKILAERDAVKGAAG